MRQIPETLAAAVEGGAASLCHAWIVTRRDGTRLGFTDHDRALAVAGVLCSAASGWTAGAADGALGEPGTASAAGVLDDAAITDADVEAGLYDGAAVERWRVDWSEPSNRVRLETGTISRIVRRGAGFTAEMEGPLARLDRVVGRIYAKTCDAVLGDGRCRAVVEPGAVCDKRWRTCVAEFANGANFRGFPGIPGDDFLTAHPRGDGRDDGGSRVKPGNDGR